VRTLFIWIDCLENTKRALWNRITAAGGEILVGWRSFYFYFNPSINAQNFGRRNANSHTYGTNLQWYISNLFIKKLLPKCLAYDRCWFGCGQIGFWIWKKISRREIQIHVNIYHASKAELNNFYVLKTGELLHHR
jgi:hypothetical protein